MIRGRIFIATLPDGSFGSAGASWKTINVRTLAVEIGEVYAVPQVVKITDLLKLELAAGDIIIYTSSDEPSVRSYIKDVLYLVAKKCSIIPRYEALLAHENKGFQELYREVELFGNLCGRYVFDADELPKDFPFVYKNITGAGSSGVSLIANIEDRRKLKRKIFRLGLKRKLIKFVRKIKLNKEEYDIYGYRHKGFSLGIYQEYLPHLAHDFKVLVFGDKYYVLKRSVRKNDFRASGSGNFNFSQAPEPILEYAEKIFRKLDVPYASLDIAMTEKRVALIEYQCLNFGPYTLLHSPGYYRREKDEWIYMRESACLENAYSYALKLYLETSKD